MNDKKFTIWMLVFQILFIIMMFLISVFAPTNYCLMIFAAAGYVGAKIDANGR